MTSRSNRDQEKWAGVFKRLKELEFVSLKKRSLLATLAVARGQGVISIGDTCSWDDCNPKVTTKPARTVRCIDLLQGGAPVRA